MIILFIFFLQIVQGAPLPNQLRKPSGNQTIWNLPGLTERQIYWLNFSFSIYAILAGLLFICAGYRFFRLSTFHLGFMVGFFLGLVGLGTQTNLEGWLVYVFAMGTALIGGLAMVVWRPLGVVVFAFFAGSFLAAELLGSTPITLYLRPNWASLIIIIAFGFIFGTLSYFFEKPTLIVSTAFCGSFLVGNLIADMVWGFSSITFLTDVLAQRLTNSYIFNLQDWVLYVVLGCVFGASGLGILGQWFISSKDYLHVIRLDDPKKDPVSSEELQPK